MLYKTEHIMQQEKTIHENAHSQCFCDISCFEQFVHEVIITESGQHGTLQNYKLSLYIYP